MIDLLFQFRSKLSNRKERYHTETPLANGGKRGDAGEPDVVMPHLSSQALGATSGKEVVTVHQRSMNRLPCEACQRHLRQGREIQQ